jgi:hypothetical protein
VLVVDDHPLVRGGLTEMINRTGDLICCGEAGTANEAQQAVAQLKPDLVLLDLRLLNGDGLELVKVFTVGVSNTVILRTNNCKASRLKPSWKSAVRIKPSTPKSLPSAPEFPTQRRVAGFTLPVFRPFMGSSSGRILSSGARIKMDLPASPKTFRTITASTLLPLQNCLRVPRKFFWTPENWFNAANEPPVWKGILPRLCPARLPAIGVLA